MAEHLSIPVAKYATVCNQYEMHFHELGEYREDRPTILFLHGSGPGASGYSNFYKNMGFFADQGWHVIVPDYLGFGLSDKPRDIIYSSAKHVESLASLLAVKGVKSVVPVGNSLGGAVSIELALTHPDLVAKLVLMAPGGLEDPALWAADMPGVAAMLKTTQERNTDREDFRKLLHHIVFNPSTITDEVIDQRLPIWIEQPPEVYSTMKVGVYKERLHELKVPILCFWGQNDEFLPVDLSQILAKRTSNTRIVIKTAVGHWFMIEQANYFNREIDEFLTNE